MDMFKNNRFLFQNDIVSLTNGKVAILFDEFEEGKMFLVGVFKEDGTTDFEQIYDEDIVERIGNSGYEIKKNAVQCSECGNEIESKFPYDNVRCSCGACTIDGGLCYIRRKVKDGAKYTELTITE